MCGISAEFLFRIMLLNFVYFENNFVTCEEITNTVFNANIRDYSVKEDDINSTKVRTLQKEEVGRYASFAPIRNPIRFKEIPDNALSSSHHSRGLLHHEHGGHEGYGIHDGYYEDGSPYGYGYIHDDHGHHGHDFDHDDHGYGHGHGHHSGHHLGHGHHHKHHDHHHFTADQERYKGFKTTAVLATKALLWPIAGIALLGAAAALVTNPVLLQLGVVSGKRRRRDTLELDSADIESDETWPLDPYGNRGESKKTTRKPSLEKVREGMKVQNAGQISKSEKVNRFIPIPLKLNKGH